MVSEQGADKTELRRRMRAMRRALPACGQEAAAQAVWARLQAFEPYRQASTVMAYIAVRGELSLEYAIRDVLASGRTLLLPRCEAPGVMTARQITGPDDLADGIFGLKEPKESCAIVQPEDIDLILVPGVAFDCAGGRLGQGGGYYDCFLRAGGARRVGVCHDFALLDGVPREAHDQAMDDVITPGGIIRTGREATGGSKHG